MAPLTLPPICLCLHPSSPSFKKDSFFLHSFLPSFFQPCGWKCVLFQGFAVQGWLFVEMGKNRQDRVQAALGTVEMQ